MKCGLIGLEPEGAALAQRILDSGHELMVLERSFLDLKDNPLRSVKIAHTPAQLGAAVDYVGICAGDDTGLREVCRTLIPAMREGSCVSIHCPALPATCTQLAGKAAARGVWLLDAPICIEETGALTMMIGADKAALASVRSFLETLAQRVVHLGGVGAGQHAKLINNALTAAHVAIAHYSMQAGAKLKLDQAALIELVRSSSGRSFGFDIYADLLAPKAFRRSAALLEKDLRLLDECLLDDNSGTLRAVSASFLRAAQK
jgi:3-hydroxyisobutyrate dehydrogenase-like beta-hydroxyacid dehydrogenase